jgi:hypothetical protein
MHRRTLLQSLASAFAVRPFVTWRGLAQSDDLTPANIATIRAIADVVLPSSLGPARHDAIVADFAGWFHNYREGADRGHSYGSSTVSSPTGPSPARRYPPQFDALDKAAADRGAASFAALAIEPRREIVEAALNTPQRVTRLPARPTGANLVADFMGFYFNSPDAFDLAYNAAIGRDTCRGLEGSDREPARTRGSAGSGGSGSSAGSDRPVPGPSGRASKVS